MKKTIRYITDIGITDFHSEEEKKRIRIINQLSLLIIFFSLVFLSYTLLFNLGILANSIGIGIVVFMTIPFLLNIKGHNIIAKIFFLCVSYVLLIGLPIIFGPNLHFQYFLISSIGIPLIFFNKEIGRTKWIFVALIFPLWMYLEWHFEHYMPFLQIDSLIGYWIRIINDGVLLLIILAMFIIFTNQNNKQLEEITNHQIKIEQTNKELEQFAYIVSHDLKAPLRGISMLVEVIKEDYAEDLGPDILDNFKLIQDRTNRMSNLITSILTYSKAGRNTDSSIKFSTNEVVNNVLSFINIPYGFDITKPNRSFEIDGQLTQFEQVISNLVGNAIKYHHQPENGKLRIEIEPINGQFLMITVQDNGPGIKSKFHEKVFQVFETVNEKSRSDSTGIGLAIVKKLVEQNQGKIGLNSVYGQGSTFWFTWPMSIS
jgi:signal transduction histidine kinase